MPPGFVIDYSSDIGLVDFKLDGNGLVRHPSSSKLANETDFLVGQLCRRAPFTTGSKFWISLPRSSALLRAIMHIIFTCPKKQMGRIAAWWVVAAVKNMKIWGYRAQCKLIGHPMGRLYFPVGQKAAITATVGSLPNPTVLRFAHSAPKMSTKILEKPTGSSATLRTKLASPLCDDAFRHIEGVTASLADTLGFRVAFPCGRMRRHVKGPFFDVSCPRLSQVVRGLCCA